MTDLFNEVHTRNIYMKIGPLDPEFYSGQDRQHTDTDTLKF